MTKFLAFVAFCFVLVNLSVTDHNIRQCADPSLAKVVLCEEDVKSSGRFLQITTYIFDCPRYGVQSNPITCIIVTNQLGENGGEAVIIDGGVNYYDVEIVLKSQLSRGLDYHIEVYTNSSA